MTNVYLNRAASWLGDFEWGQGDYGTLPNGEAYDPELDPDAQPVCACVLGAICAASQISPESDAFFDAARDLADHIGYVRYRENFEDADISIPLGALDDARTALINDLSTWNDAEVKDKAQVIQTLRAAATRAP